MVSKRGRETLNPGERLKKKTDFDLCFKQGRRMRLPGLIIIMRPNDVGYSRIGLSVGRRSGNSVVRNRIKRRMRELFRRNKELFPRGHDFVFIPGDGFLKIKWHDHIRHLQDAFSVS